MNTFDFNKHYIGTFYWIYLNRERLELILLLNAILLKFSPGHCGHCMEVAGLHHVPRLCPVRPAPGQHNSLRLGAVASAWGFQ